MKQNKVMFKKLDMDDILEILIEYFQDSNEGCQNASGIILGTPNEDLRFIGVFGRLTNSDIEKYDLEEIDKTMDYNGDHAFIKAHPECQLSQDTYSEEQIDCLYQKKWYLRLKSFFKRILSKGI